MISYVKLLGARIQSEANDLKRTPQSLANDTGYDTQTMQRLLSGEGTVEELFELIRKMGQVYPIDETDLMLVKNDCQHSVRIVRAGESEKTSRLTYRKDRLGNKSPYYEYRDTAMSKGASYRPEWIRMLRHVENTDPNNPDVQFNRGHFLHQYTLFIGPVNYYWEVNGTRYGREMNTGDSVYITPWWPHSFASRNKDAKAYILAVTLGGDVRRAQKELYLLGKKSKNYLLQYRNSHQSSAQLIKQHMANNDLTPELLELRASQQGLPLNINKILQGEHALTIAEREILAQILEVDEMDLMVLKYKESDEVLFKFYKTEEEYFYPTSNHRNYSIHRMAETTKMPLSKGLTIKVLNTEANLDHGFCVSLHSWVYNYGSTPVLFRWKDEEKEYTETINPEDSIYIQPFIPHAFGVTTSHAVPTLCIIRTPGAINLQTQREMSYLSQVDRISYETGCWF